MVGTFLAFVKKTLNGKKMNVTSVVNSFSDPGDTVIPIICFNTGAQSIKLPNMKIGHPKKRD